MASVLIVYSTIDGHTPEICARICKHLADKGHDVSLAELTADSTHDLSSFEAVVIGASIRYGKHRPDVAKLIEKEIEVLRSRPSAFFSVNAVARKPEKRDAETNPYVRKFLKSISWQPALVGVFGGKIDYPKYGTFDRTMIRFIMWMTKGPTDPTGTFEFTDWDQVDRFAEAFAAGIGNTQS
jgi:menaquinone-dependent protoporphyrinogen oxidase